MINVPFVFPDLRLTVECTCGRDDEKVYAFPFGGVAHTCKCLQHIVLNVHDRVVSVVEWNLYESRILTWVEPSGENLDSGRRKGLRKGDKRENSQR